MLSDPEPKIFVSQTDGESAVLQRHADRPDFLAAPVADLLELQRRVLRIGFQQRKLLVRPSLNVRRKTLVIVQKNPRSRDESSHASKRLSVSGTAISQSAGNALVEAPGVEIGLKLYVDGAISIHPRVQLGQFLRRKRTDRTFDL
jgi:hypothetical protein